MLFMEKKLIVQECLNNMLGGCVCFAHWGFIPPLDFSILKVLCM